METIKNHSAVYERLKANGAFDVTGNATGDGTVTVCWAGGWWLMTG